MTRFTISRRTFVGGAAGAAGLTAFGARAQAQLAMPSAPVALNIIDVAGNLALTQKAIENYRKEKPKRSRASPSRRRRRPSCPARSRRSRTPTGSISTWC